ncbi:MAG TPA: hypothetical protein VK509_04600, partial [Polyangiales bacterium]|nr:hypothetical protein [Polyangiales bacterium]
RAHGAAGASRSSVRVSASVTAIHGRYRLALRVEDRGAVAERALDGDDCDALADAAALLIALALERSDDESAAANAQSPPAEAQSRAPTNAGTHAGTEPGADAGADATPANPLPRTQRQPRSTSDEAPAASAERERLITVSPDNEVLERSGGSLEVRFALGAALALDAGMLPRAPALAVEPLLQLHVASLRMQLGLGLWLARSGESERYARAQLSGSGAVGKLSLGADLLQAPLVFGPRALLELGQLAVKTSGISLPQRGRATWIAAGAALHLGYPVARRLELALELGVLFPFARPRWLLRTPDGAVDLFTAAPAVLRVTSGVAYAFP